MNAKNYLIDFYIPKEDKFKVLPFLLGYLFISTLLYSSLNSVLHMVGIQTFVEIIYC